MLWLVQAIVDRKVGEAALLLVEEPGELVSSMK